MTREERRLENDAREKEIAEFTIDGLVKTHKIDFKDKKVLDIGYGTGANLLRMMDHGADVWGYEIYEFSDTYTQVKIPGRTFLSDVRELPGSQNHTFDIALQTAFLVSDEDTPSVMATAVRALKSTGKYILTFVDMRYKKEDSIQMKTLRKLFGSVEISKNPELPYIMEVIASKPRIRTMFKSGGVNLGDGDFQREHNF